MRVGIAGAGFMGDTHAQNYLKLDSVELYALAERNKDKQNCFTAKYPNLKIYSDVFEMIDDDTIDIIDICLPTPMHAAAAVAALRRNKHVLLEKPIALNLSDAELIKSEAAKSKGKLMIAHVLRFWPEYVMMRNIIKYQMLDEKIVSVYASRFNELPLWSDGTWIMQEDQSGGIIIDLMIHDIDFILWNFGKVKRVFSNAIYNSSNFAVQVMAILEMQCGAYAYIEGGYLNPHKAGLSSQMRVYTNKSLIEMYSHLSKLKLVQNGNDVKEIAVSGEDGYYSEIKYFVNCIKNDSHPAIVTTCNAIESLKVCIELKKSLQTDKWIDIC